MYMGIHKIVEASSSRSHEEEIMISWQGEVFATTEVTSPQTTSSYAEPKMQNLDEVEIHP